MSDDHLVSVADAACAPSGRMSDMSWPGIMPRTANQTDRHPLTSAHCFGSSISCRAPGGIHMGVESCLALNTEGVKVSVYCGYTQPLNC